MKAALLSLAVAATAHADFPAHLVIDQSHSSVTVQLTILTSSATDSSPVTGFYDLRLNSRTAPTQVGLTNFYAALTDDLVLNVNLSILGRFNSNANDLVIYYADAPALFGPVAINATNFTFVDLPTRSTGTLAYTATGFVCTQMQNSGLACTDTINLADQPASPQTVNGTLTVSNSIATVTGHIDSTQPLDPDNPALGSIHITGTIVASGPVLCSADFNRDLAVDFFDYLDFVQAFSTGSTTADFNTDGVVDFFDYLDFVNAFASGC
jgi:hypothetical protein